MVKRFKSFSFSRQSLLGLDQPSAAVRLQHGGKPPLEDLDPGNLGDGYFVFGVRNAPVTRG